MILIAILGVEYCILAKTNWFPQNNWQFLPDFGCWGLKFVGFIIFWYANLLISYISSLLLGRWSPVIYSFWGVRLFLREYLQENHGKPYIVRIGWRFLFLFFSIDWVCLSKARLQMRKNRNANHYISITRTCFLVQIFPAKLSGHQKTTYKLVTVHS